MAGARVTVSDPQKIGDGMSAYVSYKVAVTVSLQAETPHSGRRSAHPPLQFAERPPGVDASSYTVLRRFNDFLWLRTELRNTLPYLIVPSLPEKQQMGRFNAEFIDVRHRALQRFVARIVAHPGEIPISRPTHT